MSDWFGILLTILSIFIGGFALGNKCGKEIGTNADVPDGNVEDIISRQAAIDALYHVDEYNGRSIEVIRNLPSAQPDRTGKWIDNETSYADGVVQTCDCSRCGQRSARPLGDFCKWCGAFMR